MNKEHFTSRPDIYVQSARDLKHVNLKQAGYLKYSKLYRSNFFLEEMKSGTTRPSLKCQSTPVGRQRMS